jgi:hypothetical protein
MELAQETGSRSHRAFASWQCSVPSRMAGTGVSSLFPSLILSMILFLPRGLEATLPRVGCKCLTLLDMGLVNFVDYSTAIVVLSH